MLLPVASDPRTLIWAWLGHCYLKLHWRLLIKTKGLDKANVHYLKLKGFPLALFAQGRGRALPNDSTQSLELQNPLHHTLGQVQMAAAQKQCKKVDAVSNSFLNGKCDHSRQV